MNTLSLLQEGERIDDLQRNGLKIIQDPEKFCFGMDAVLLSSFITIRKNDMVLDLCTGTGVIPLLLTAKTEAAHIDALEIQADSVDMAKRSVLLNHLEDKVTIYEGDVKKASALLGRGKYHAVTVNPPYMNDNHGLKNPALPKAIARHEILCSLEDVLRESQALLLPGGHFFMVHRPFRLPEILNKMIAYRLEPKRLRLVYPYLNKEPNMILIEGVRNGNAMLKVEAPLVIYGADGRYTPEVLALYDQ